MEYEHRINTSNKSDDGHLNCTIPVPITKTIA